MRRRSGVDLIRAHGVTKRFGALVAEVLVFEPILPPPVITATVASRAVFQNGSILRIARNRFRHGEPRIQDFESGGKIIN